MLRITKSNHFELPVEVSDELFEAVQISLKNKTWDNLTQEQKDYINIAEGFNANIHDKNHRNQGRIGRQYMDTEVQQFYSSVSDINYERLEQGLNIGNFKTTFPRKFEESPSVHARALLARTSHQSYGNELEVIVDKILKLA